MSSTTSRLIVQVAALVLSAAGPCDVQAAVVPGVTRVDGVAAAVVPGGLGALIGYPLLLGMAVLFVALIWALRRPASSAVPVRRRRVQAPVTVVTDEPRRRRTARPPATIVVKSTAQAGTPCRMRVARLGRTL